MTLKFDKNAIIRILKIKLVIKFNILKKLKYIYNMLKIVVTLIYIYRKKIKRSKYFFDIRIFYILFKYYNL